MYMNISYRQGSQFLQHVSGHMSEATVMSHLHICTCTTYGCTMYMPPCAWVYGPFCIMYDWVVLACPCSSAKVRNMDMLEQPLVYMMQKEPMNMVVQIHVVG